VRARVAISDPTGNSVVITTRHNSHARYVMAALDAGKRAFVEKPLCLTREELAEIDEALTAAAAPF